MPPSRIGAIRAPRRHIADLGRPGQPRLDMAEIGLEAIGRWVFDSRRRAGLTQLQLERMTNVDQTTISRLERGVLPGLALKRVAALVGCLVMLLGGNSGRRLFG